MNALYFFCFSRNMKENNCLSFAALERTPEIGEKVLVFDKDQWHRAELGSITKVSFNYCFFQIYIEIVSGS